MESELVRLATYSSFPLATSSRWCPSRLSRLGFHYDSVSGRVVCGRCRFGAELRSVDDERDFHVRHHRQSPNCEAPPETSDVIASRDPLTDRPSSPESTTASEFISTIITIYLLLLLLLLNEYY